MNRCTFDRLPKRLTVSFPLWLIYGTKGENYRITILIRLCVSYIASKDILWEEHSEAYWELVKYGLDLYKKAGVWGTVIRTCCGPEDPCWTLCKDKLTELNRFFLED